MLTNISDLDRYHRKLQLIARQPVAGNARIIFTLFCWGILAMLAIAVLLLLSYPRMQHYAQALNVPLITSELPLIHPAPPDADALETDSLVYQQLETDETEVGSVIATEREPLNPPVDAAVNDVASDTESDLEGKNQAFDSNDNEQPAEDIIAETIQDFSETAAGNAAINDLPPAAEQGRWLLQLAAYTSLDQARAAWSEFQQQYAPHVTDLTVRYSEVTIAEKDFFRLQAGYFASNGAATKWCSWLRQQQQPCLVIVADE